MDHTRAPVAHDGPLDLRGGVLDNRAPGLHRGEHRDAARVPEPQGAAHVIRVKQVFDRDAVGTALREQHRQLVMDPGQSQGKGFGDAGADRPTGDQAMPASVASAWPSFTMRPWSS